MSKLTVAVCIATTGRPSVLTEALRHICVQSYRPETILICAMKDGDVDEVAMAALPFPVGQVAKASGLAAQRNVLLRAVGSADVVLFIDDDFLAAPSYVAEAVRLFEARPNAVVLTGTLLADGALGPGYSVAEGKAILRDAALKPEKVEAVYNAYGCNMVLRWSALRLRNCWFDEQLPLYAWAEDVDFSRQVAAFGAVYRSNRMIGVHLAAKHGRVSGVRFGYSQIANPAYLARKGTITPAKALRKALANVLANVRGTMFNTEAYIDRRGRLKGNMQGLADLAAGRCSPMRILDL